MKDSLCVREIFVEAIYDEIEFIVNILLRRSLDKFHPIDNSILRQQLLALLTKYNLTDLLKENGGKHTFGDSWAHRFFARHVLS